MPAVKRKTQAPIFAALGDDTRLTLLDKLGTGTPHSISELSEGLPLTRQAVTKHLRVLEGAGIVRNVRKGRQSLFAIEPDAIAIARQYLDEVSAQWDDALARLKSFVED